VRKRTVSVNHNSYDILLGQDLLSGCGQLIRQVSKANRAVIVSDSNVFPLYGEAVQKSLEEAGFSVCSFVFPAGEKSKTLATVEGLYECLSQSYMTRSDILVALGGGVTGDMAGFAAATYLRGIDFVQIPTTLLSQIDSSVGGKTGVDLPLGKNMVGAFYQPRLVLMDTNTLQTLPARYFADGMAEVIKTAAIRSEALFERLEKEQAEDFLEDMIFECLCIKAGIVERDEKEQNERKLLNFGHTLGHAIENYLHYDIMSHGEAVGVGMVLLTDCCEKAGLSPEGTGARIAALLARYNLPQNTDIPMEALAPLTRHDKKQGQGGLSLVYLSRIGCGEIKTLTNQQLESLLLSPKKSK